MNSWRCDHSPPTCLHAFISSLCFTIASIHEALSVDMLLKTPWIIWFCSCAAHLSNALVTAQGKERSTQERREGVKEEEEGGG